MSNRLRRICPGCKQGLSRSAYYRHQNYPASCPSNQRPTQGEILSDQECNSPLLENSNDASDLHSEHSVHDASAADSVGDNCTDTSGDETEELEMDEVEVATNDITCGGQEQTRNDDRLINSILKAISFTLLFFQLKFRVPDRAIIFLLSFLKGLIRSLISMIPSCQPLQQIYECFPQSLHSLRQRFSASNCSLTEFVVCPKCSTLYTRDECFVMAGNSMVSKTCSFIEFPNHPQRHRRTPCGTLLMKQVKYGSALKLLLKKTFIKSVITALKTIVFRPGILKQCNDWCCYRWCFE